MQNTVLDIHLTLVNVTQILCILYRDTILLYTTFPLSPFFLVLELCTQYIEKIQHPKLSMYFLLCYSKHKEKCNVTHSVCIWCNVLRTGRMGTIQRLYKSHKKTPILYKIHRFYLILILIFHIEILL